MAQANACCCATTLRRIAGAVAAECSFDPVSPLDLLLLHHQPPSFQEMTCTAPHVLPAQKADYGPVCGGPAGSKKKTAASQGDPLHFRGGAWRLC